MECQDKLIKEYVIVEGLIQKEGLTEEKKISKV